jgi:hypothetical protein
MNPLSKPVPNDDRVKEAFEVLSRAFDEDLPRVQEPQFRETILPLILSKTPPTSFEAWLRVSDSVLRPITVWSGNTMLFKCPAIGRPMNFGLARSPRDSMFEHVTKAIQKDDVIPNLGQKYLNNCLRDRILSGRLDNAEVAEWRKVFDYYGISEIPEDATDVRPGSVPAKAVVDAPLASDGFLSDEFDLA